MSSDETSAGPETWEVPPQGTPCWIEIPAVDVEKAKAFYSAVFPEWNWRSLTARDTLLFSFQKGSLSGGIVKVEKTTTDTGEQQRGTGYVVYHMVDSLEDTGKKIISLGGRQIVERTAESDHGFYEQYRDVAGNIFAIYEMKK